MRVNLEKIRELCGPPGSKLYSLAKEIGLGGDTLKALVDGTKDTISDIQLEKLSDYFKVDPGVFLSPYRRVTSE